MSNTTDQLLDTLSDVASDLMMIDSPEDTEIDAVRQGLENLRERFSVLHTLESDSDQPADILSALREAIDELDEFVDSDTGDNESRLKSLRQTVSQIEELVREYGDSIDTAEEANQSSGNQDSARDIPPREQLESFEYRDLQELAKEHDVKANLAIDEIIDALLAIRAERSENMSTDSSSESVSDQDEPSESNENDGTLVTEPDTYDEEMFYDFFSEATEHLENFEDILLQLEHGRDMDALNEGFRGMHSIKGAAGFLNLRWVNNLSHAMEELLGLFRDENYGIEEEHVDLLFDALDSLKQLINLHYDTVETGESRALADDEFKQQIDRVRSMTEEIKSSGEKIIEGAESAEEESPEAREDVELRETESIRVDTEKIDTLVNRAGELVTTFNQLKRGEKQNGHSRSREQQNMLNQMDRIVSDLQEEALSLRMVPLKKTFSKTKRMVRDLSKEFGKEINLEIEGDDTELDRSLVEKIQDPLVHLVRNAVDHGIEDPETRREKGKDPEGTLSISAFHESGDVIIEITDDGAGIDTDEVFERAVDNGLVEANQQLSDQEIYMLLFEPGFTTTDEVTDVSGRGVGMNVVKENVESIRGSIKVLSEVDEGSTFRLQIPLTLSVINGMIMKLGHQRFVIPTANIYRSLKPDESQITTVKNRGDVLNLRGDLITLCRLNSLFGMDIEDRPFSDSLIVIVQGSGRRIGLQVDELLGQQEVVIKSLGIAFEDLPGISGAAILGDGQVGLILDTQTLGQIVRSKSAR